jgi:diguanylate cyclase (GGDEF)-like protein
VTINRQTILIVDDSVANIEILSNVIGTEYDVTFATNGQEALDLVRLQNPDLILLDVIMPGMDGYEVCKQIKQDGQTHDIPVIFVTAMDQEGDESKGLEAGGIDYITKPIRPSIVKARVHNHLELKQYRDLLKVFSEIDGLTGIANRRRLDKFLNIEWERAGQLHKPISFLLIDVDYFKEYNDHYGHLAGDDCLQKLGKGIAEVCRSHGDLVARYGGDEFAVLLPDTNIEGALNVAKRVEEKIKEINIPHCHATNMGRVTLSIGVAMLIPSDDLSEKDLLRFSDEALYQSKQNGRNQISSMTF